MDSISPDEVRRLLDSNSREVYCIRYLDADPQSPPLPISPSSPSSPIHGLEAGIQMLDLAEGSQTLAYTRVVEPKDVAKALEASNEAITTAEKDKFWLKAFRTHMKSHYESLKPTITPEEKRFWKWFLRGDGKPRSGHSFPSYNRYYRDRLFREQCVRREFGCWFEDQGEKMIQNRDGSEAGRVLVKHAREELLGYEPQEKRRSESPEYFFDIR